MLLGFYCELLYIVNEGSSKATGHTDLNNNSGFPQTHIIGNIGISANSVFPYICSFIINICHTNVVNIELYISGYKRIIFQGCRLHWSCSFLMAQLKQSWQYWHSCIAESLWKTLLCPSIHVWPAVHIKSTCLTLESRILVLSLSSSVPGVADPMILVHILWIFDSLSETEMWLFSPNIIIALLNK